MGDDGGDDGGCVAGFVRRIQQLAHGVLTTRPRALALANAGRVGFAAAAAAATRAVTGAAAQGLGAPGDGRLGAAQWLCHGFAAAARLPVCGAELQLSRLP